MELVRLVNHINLATDEDFEMLEVIGFLNDAIARINIEMDAVFPMIDEDLPDVNMYQFEEYEAIPDHWQRQLLVPYAAGRIKENDSSQFEYTDWYAQFEHNLDRFRSKYEVPLIYKDLTTKAKRYEEDQTANIFSHMRGW